MTFQEFADTHPDSYVVESGFLFWKISGSVPEPCSIAFPPHIIVHVVIWAGELSLRSGGCEYRLVAGTYANFLHGASIDILAASPDARGYFTASSDGYTRSLLNHNPPMPLSFVLRVQQHPVAIMPPEVIATYRRRLADMEGICLNIDHSFRDDMLRCAQRMFLMDIADSHIRLCEDSAPLNSRPDRRRDLFIAFIKLVSTHADVRHSVDFFASQLCVTPQYLNRISRACSGKTVHDWICFYIVGKIERRLEYTDDTLQQIAADLHFPDQAALAKFFKRHAGSTLSDFRRNGSNG
ncbi:MAG: helix-turn-helix domain-containing protein [Muribaculaceae bacterium]